MSGLEKILEKHLPAIEKIDKRSDESFSTFKKRLHAQMQPLRDELARTHYEFGPSELSLLARQWNARFPYEYRSLDRDFNPNFHKFDALVDAVTDDYLQKKAFGAHKSQKKVDKTHYARSVLLNSHELFYEGKDSEALRSVGTTGLSAKELGSFAKRYHEGVGKLKRLIISNEKKAAGRPLEKSLVALKDRYANAISIKSANYSFIAEEVADAEKKAKEEAAKK